jgi:hypothetical protein
MGKSLNMNYVNCALLVVVLVLVVMCCMNNSKEGFKRVKGGKENTRKACRAKRRCEEGLEGWENDGEWDEREVAYKMGRNSLKHGAFTGCNCPANKPYWGLPECPKGMKFNEVSVTCE